MTNYFLIIHRLNENVNDFFNKRNIEPALPITLIATVSKESYIAKANNETSNKFKVKTGTNPKNVVMTAQYN